MATIFDKDESIAVTTLDPVVLAELIKLASTLRNKQPSQAATREVLKSRREFLRESLGEAVEADDIFERIIRGDELQPVAYLERGMIASRAVARVDIGGGKFGTGFLVAPQVLITNNHVLHDIAEASQATAQFHFEVDLSDAEVGPVVFRLAPETLFYTSKDLDYSVVAVNPSSRDDAMPLSQFGYLPLLEMTGKVSECEWLTIIQHPEGARKQICVRDNQFVKRENDVIWYSTDTQPGSSGSPVFNNDWYVVALHHSGVPDTRDGVTQKNADGSTRWIANEGIRASRIVQTLKQALPQHPLLLPLYAATPASARITKPTVALPSSSPRPRENIMPDNRTVTVPLEIKLQLQADGQVGAVSTVVRQGAESVEASSVALLERKTRPTASFDAPFDEDYSKRKGYDPGFLGCKQANRVGMA